MYNNREYQKTYITTAATTLIFSGRGNLGGICINSATAVGTITLQDGATTFAVLAAATPVGEYLKNLVVSNGLTVINASTNDMVVKWVKA